MEWSRKAACIIDGPSLRAVQRGEGVVNGPEQAILGGVGVGAMVGVWEMPSVPAQAPWEVPSRWAVGMVPGPEQGCPG